MKIHKLDLQILCCNKSQRFRQLQKQNSQSRSSRTPEIEKSLDEQTLVLVGDLSYGVKESRVFELFELVCPTVIVVGDMLISRSKKKDRNRF